ncbi:MAG: hypothetical protein QOK40_3008 [Miltoncostaeaceae bacterium]|jgi:hypothetical protein|nr:hypothetical protein [Miltoncostaeaceae bacterium]
MNHPAALRGARARPWASLALAGLLTMTAAGTARADITGTVANGAGVPIGDVRVEVTDANARFADSQYTNAVGVYTIPTSGLTGSTPPYTLKTSKYDNCPERPYAEANREATAGPVNDGAPGVPSVANLALDIFDVCAGSQGSGAEPTGIVDAVARRTVVPPGGIVYLRVLAHSSAVNFQVQLADGTPIGGSASDTTILISAPAAGYDGPLNLVYTVDGVPVSRGLGTLTSRAIAPPVPLPGPIDIEAIVDVSGSMSGTDPKFVRKDAVNLLAELVRPADRLGAVGFDDDYQPIFDSTIITGAASVVNALKAAANKGIINSGSTNYNVGMDKAYEALTGAGVDPNRQKAVIFLTDGGHNSGTYLNGHLRFAYNPSGRPWPVCAVQLGSPSSFQPTDVARLKRIAAETGGQYFATSTAAQLTDIYFRCFGRTTGQQTLQTKVFTYVAGQQRNFKQKLARGLPSATFFVGWGDGRYRLELVDPKGKVHTRAKPGKAFTFRGGASFGFFRVNKPAAGLWRLRVLAQKLTTTRDRARTTITVPPRK